MEKEDCKVYGVIVVEDNHAVRAQLESAIGSHPQLRLIASVASLAEGRKALDARPPDTLLVDLGLPDGSGIELIRQSRRAAKKIECMVVTIHDDEAHVLEALEAGATGYILKDATAEAMTDSIMELMHGGSPISPTIARSLLKRLPLANNSHAHDKASLTAREADVLNHLARGLTRSEIARHTNVSIHTVNTHIKHIYEKLAVRSSGEAVYVARKSGLISQNEV